MREQMRPVEGVTVPNGVMIQHYRHEGVELDDVPPCGDVLLAYRLAGAVKAECKLAGQWRRAVTRRGSITILPAGQNSCWRLRGKGSILHFHLPLALLEQIAGEGDRCIPAALVERLGAHDEHITGLVEALVREVQEDGLGAALYVEALTVQIAVYLVRGHGQAWGTRRRAGPTGLRNGAKRRISDHIEGSIDREINLTDLAKLAGSGLTQFSQNFRATFGTSPHRYVTERRIARAKALLTDTDLTIVEIAFASGFAHQAHLTTTFKRICGQTPGAYRADKVS
jgi:AraC family transcriptional regulator